MCRAFTKSSSAAASLQSGRDSTRVDRLKRAFCLAFLGLSWPAFGPKAWSSMPEAEKWWDENTTAVVTGGICRLKPQHHDMKLSRQCCFLSEE